MSIETPDWAKDAVIYLIFPDRFAKSGRVSKPAHLLAWDSHPTAQGYYGGDLLGIAEHLDYLEALGINTICLTPIFQSGSNHRYHTHDYEKVDPLLGGNAALRALVEAAHRRNIRILLDGVFNHASRGFFQFHDILENGPNSPWLDWFTVERWPLSPYDGSKPANYVSWHDYRALPKFNTQNPEVREFLMRIGELWLREYDIDGWRLDVPSEIKTEGFWEEFRCRVRAVKPDAYIVGEIWQEAREWLQGDRFDAVMNYRFAAATIAFAAGQRVSQALVKDRKYDPHPGIDAAQFGAKIQRILNLYDWEVSQVLFNVLDSHDTARLLSIARGDRATVRLATFFQMTYPGIPVVYYGDEIGLPGTENYDAPHRDEEARRPFPWDNTARWDTDMLGYFKALIGLRREHAALRRGHFYQLYAEGDCFAFARRGSDETLVAVMNVADEARDVLVPVGAYFADGVELRPIFGPARGGVVRDGQVSLAVPAREGLILSA